jgi:hypothetical protein
MGLTIHYTIGFKGNAEELLSKLQLIKNQCMDLLFEEVSNIEHLRYSKEDYLFYQDMEQKTFYPNNTPQNMEKARALYQSRGIDRDALIEYDVYHRTKRIQPIEMVNWSVWAGPGCEGSPFNFFKKRTRWQSHCFTKTQYAEQFVKCHLLVIQVLDLFKEHGFDVKVKDEGHYWETRDLEVLAKNLNDYTGLLVSTLETLSGEAKKVGIIVAAPITECQNYMTVKKKDK